MRIGLISDIHSNVEALDAVLFTLDRLRIDRLICLGDLVGYGGSPNEVMDRLAGKVEFTCMGNHDAAVAGQMEFHYYYDSAKEVLMWTREILKPEHLESLKRLPYFRILEQFCFVHGEPLQPEAFNYIYTMEHARSLLQHYDLLQWVTFVGHSHLRRAYQFDPDEVVDLPVDNLTLREDRKYVFAIGSVGQPRDSDPRAAFAVFDTTRARMEFYRAPYDVDGAAEHILKAGLPEYFASRLFSGT